MMTKIWQRYFIKEILKIFLLIIFCFYSIYVLIDYANHSSTQHRHSQNFWSELFHYYLAEFIQKLDVIIPFALLIATIRTLSLLRSQNELTAFLASGIKIRTLLRPFLFIGLLCTAFMYLNIEFFIPNALTELRHIHDKRTLEKNKKNKNISAKHVALKDNTLLLFQKYDTLQKKFFDVYWVRSADDVYRIKYLHPGLKIPSGEFVEHYTRNPAGQLTKSASFETKLFPDMQFNKTVLLDSLTESVELPLSELWKKHLENSGKTMGEKEASIDAALFRKLAIPWFCLLAVIAPIPFCIRFSRDQSMFFIYAFSIFGLLSCFLILDAAWVLAERQVLPPAWAIGVPFAFLLIPPLFRYLLIR